MTTIINRKGVKNMGEFFSLSLLICLFLQCSICYSWTSLDFLDLGSNLLEGPLPPSLCKMGNLKYLLLSDNQLTGTIPDCLGKMSMQLTVLDLRKNRFHGKIPTNFPEGYTLRNLGLNGNQLEGTLPMSLLNCRILEVLDVGHNNIRGSFPAWLGTLPALSVLILKSNHFDGPVSISSNTSFQKLRILDISYNKFNGFLPAEMVDSFQATKKNDNQTDIKYMGDNTYYEDSVTLSIKGLEMEIKRVLTIFTTIDLSGNRFEGSIPKSIGELSSLKVLNFSHNQFGGVIPATIGDLLAIESLDLSGNQLSGKIPTELGNLNFLEALNLSENRLVGRIPTGGQLNTFTFNSYVGNPGLCGFPLDDCEKLPGGSQSLPNYHQTHHLETMDGLTWESVVLGFGCGLILGLLMGGLMFCTHKPIWFHAIVRDMCEQSKRQRREGLNRRKIRRA